MVVRMFGAHMFECYSKMGDWTHVGFLMNTDDEEEEEPNTVIEIPSTDVPIVPGVPGVLSLTMCCLFGMACLAYVWYKK